MKAETGQDILPQTPFFMISLGLCSAAPHFPRVWLGGGRDRGWGGGRNSRSYSYPKGAGLSLLPSHT